MSDARRAIPSVERLLSSPPIENLLARESRPRVIATLRAVQAEIRAGNTGLMPTDAEWYAHAVEERLQRATQPSLCDVINATGVVLHTNLGRAPLAAPALEAMTRVARDYSNLEYDLGAGRRGSRYVHCRELLRSLTGAEAALVVNNNAAALVLTLNTIALQRGVLISRGELVEIGDTFRIAEIIQRSGALPVEVGATNRTHFADYANAVTGAAAILKVHPSNYQTTGFVASVPAEELAGLARSAAVAFVHDLGSGLLESLADLGLSGEPTVAQALAAGADIVTMSGDKLLGGPQAGIILGRAELIAAIKRNPLCRALRVDKLTLSALEATLHCYVRGTARSDIPVLRMIAADAPELRARAERVATALQTAGIPVSVLPGTSAIGGGAFPGAELPTSLIAVAEPNDAAARIEERLRAGTPAVVARIMNQQVLIDLRTVPAEQEVVLIARIVDACN